MMQNVEVTDFTSSELLREKKREGGEKKYPPPRQIRVKTIFT